MSATKMYKRTLIGLICAGVLILLACGFLYSNRSSKLHALQVECNNKQSQMDSSAKIAARLPVARREFEEAQAQLSFLEQGVSSKAYVPTFLRQIEELGRKNHLQVAGVRPKQEEVKPPVVVASQASDSDDKKKAPAVAKPKPPEPYDKLNLDIEMKGKYWDVVRFMQEITSFPKIVAVNDIQIAPESRIGLTGSPKLTIRFNATAFILKDQVGPDPKGAKSTKVIADARDGDKG